MTKNKFYITTTIPYANAPPHIGFALEIVQADVLARWNKVKGNDVFFLTGTDEHGVKNYQTAKEQGLNPQAFVDKNSAYFRELTEKLNISNNYFIRTTDKNVHWPGVVQFWKILVKKGDIYKRYYEGFYCTGCERFVTEKDLVNNQCSNHPNLKIEKISEENYFFKLSKYSKKIIELIKKDSLCIYPKKSKNDFLSLIKEGLTDVSFSRDKAHLPWGIPVPNDSQQVMYVWPDALTNYLTGVGYPNKKYQKYWPVNIHVVGKDMLRFHAGIWPGMLLSAGLSLPKKIIVHGFLTVNGQKMSKSLGNVINPLELRKNYDSDSIRYTLMRSIPFGEDGDFSEKALIERNNNELADKFGNLISRVSSLIEKNGIVKTENKLLKKLKLKEIEKFMENYQFDKAISEIFSYIDICNGYVQEKELWKSGDKKSLYELADSIKVISVLLWPFIPETCEKIALQFSFKIGKDSYKEIKNPLKVSSIKKGEILFKKIEIKNNPNEKGKLSTQVKQEKVNKYEKIEGVMSMSEVDFSEWSKLDLRVAKILEVEDIPNADKLYKLTLDVGKEIGKRTICAGIKEFYSKKELKGKKIILFVNLKPRIMKGIESQGMLLAAGSKESNVCVLISPEKDIEVGSKVS